MRPAHASGRRGRRRPRQLAPASGMLVLGALLLAGCAGTDPPVAFSGSQTGSPPPSVRGYKVGKPYQIKGIWYYPRVDYEYRETGIASWYGPGFHGRETANGEIYDMNDLTAAHRTLPMPSLVRVTNLENGRSLQLRVNDRGPFYGDRIIDVSRRAAQMLGFYGAGTAHVEVEIMAEESRQMAAALGVPVDASPAPSVQTAAASTPSPAPVAPEPAPSSAEPAYAEPAGTGSWAALPEPPAEDVLGAAATMVASAELSAPDAAIAPEVLPDQTAAAARARPPVAPHGLRARYVQAGAFADPARADQVRRRLAGIGPVVMSPSEVNGRALLRVRVGPLDSDADADRVLASVTQAGFPESRLVHE